MTFRKFKWSYDEEVLKMTKSSKKLTAFGIALALAILIGGFLLHTWGRTKSELTVTKVDLSNNSIYATAPNQLYGTDNCYLIQGASEYLKGNIQLSQIEEGEKIVVDSNGKFCYPIRISLIRYTVFGYSNPIFMP